MEIEEFQKRLNYSFRDISILKTALTHSSAVNEMHSDSNQRLEFLGDAVLQLTISSFLFEKILSGGEGALSKTRSLIVCADSLSEAAEALNLKDYLMLGKGEIMSGGKDKKNILADAYEAVTGAIYDDGGYDAAQTFVLTSLSDIIDRAISGKLTYDYKTALQEFVQSQGLGTLHYELIDVSGPEHDRTYASRAVIGETNYPAACGHNRKQSEQNAASEALSVLKAFE